LVYPFEAAPHRNVLKSNRPLDRSYGVLCTQNGLPCAVILVGFLAVKFAMMINPNLPARS
jgi:hypothetical protein